ncbi:MAG TPA: hypothetical protein VIY86_05990 [Pirellulaceae bacterium]
MLLWSLAGLAIAAGQETEGEGSKSGEPSDPTFGELILGAERLRELRGSAAEESASGPASDPVAAEVPSEPLLAAAKIRKIEGKHLTLLTDLPSQFAVDELPKVFDRAVPAWAAYFRLDPQRLEGWRVVGCLMKDRDPFQATGLFPATLPPFEWGFQRGDRIWWYEQSTDYFRRHLMLHEGVHAFMRSKLGGTGPPWYREGMAERLATHRWTGGELEVGIVPRRRDDVMGWGRMDALRRGFDAGNALMIRDVMNVDSSVFQESEPYAWCWAAVTFLDLHPATRIRFRRMMTQVSDETTSFNRQLQLQFAQELRELDEQWQIFIAEADYGYDFQRAAVRYASGKPLPAEGSRIAVMANRGWQSAGFRLEKDKSYLLKADGNFQIARERRQPWLSEAGGVTLRYHRGYPLGMLMGQVRLDQPESGPSNLISPVAVGTLRKIRPIEAGTLYFMVNDHPAERSDNQGGVVVEVRELSDER